MRPPGGGCLVSLVRRGVSWWLLRGKVRPPPRSAQISALMATRGIDLQAAAKIYRNANPKPSGISLLAELHDLHLDTQRSAMLLWGGEYGQEQGLYPDALENFQKVLLTNPHSIEAQENARMTAEAIKGTGKVGKDGVEQDEGGS